MGLKRVIDWRKYRSKMKLFFSQSKGFISSTLIADILGVLVMIRHDHNSCTKLHVLINPIISYMAIIGSICIFLISVVEFFGKNKEMVVKLSPTSNPKLLGLEVPKYRYHGHLGEQEIILIHLPLSGLPTFGLVNWNI